MFICLRDEESEAMKSTSTDVEQFKEVQFSQDDMHEIQERAESMKNIERMLKDIGQLYEKLGSMIKEHELMIDRIDNNTEDALHNVTRARNEISDIYRNMSSNREIILKVSVFCQLLIIINFLKFLGLSHFDNILCDLYSFSHVKQRSLDDLSH